ncbi:unnamed protein product, partial [Brachionus calyciflorus]
MKKKLKLRNDMEKYLELRLMSSQNIFTKIEELQADGFPKLENLENDEDSKIVFAKIQSRHSNSLKYKIFLRFKPHSNNLDNLSWVCSSKTGKRTLGCCSHVAALIYFMGYGRYHLENIPKPGIKLKKIIIPIFNDTDDDEDVS